MRIFSSNASSFSFCCSKNSSSSSVKTGSFACCSKSFSISLFISVLSLSFGLFVSISSLSLILLGGFLSVSSVFENLSFLIVKIKFSLSLPNSMHSSFAIEDNSKFAAPKSRLGLSVGKRIKLSARSII